MVRAKFLCSNISHTHLQGSNPDAIHVEVTLAAVWNDGKGNESWSKATPSGQIKMAITNPDAANAFELGKFYFVDFTPADQAKP